MTATIGLNHAVLWVSDPVRSSEFYCAVLGFEELKAMKGAVFLGSPKSPNDHDLGLFRTPTDRPQGERPIGLYHTAWEVETLRDLVEVARRLSERGALVGASDHGTTKSLYAHDPDGIEFEVMWQVPLALLPDDVEVGTRALDIDAEIRTYGADTIGGRTADAAAAG